jgi:hypothetical protein
VQLEVTREAGRRIRQRTGELYLWLEPVGQTWVSDELDFERPEGVDFRRHRDAGVEIFLGTDVKAQHVRVTGRLWPFRGVKVLIDGKRWGRRGRAGGETALDFGGAGPP